MTLHIGNISPAVTEEELRHLFGKYGTVRNAEIEWPGNVDSTYGRAVVKMFMGDGIKPAESPIQSFVS